MGEHKTPIVEKMAELVARWMDEGPLLDHAKSFIDAKKRETMVFGELAFCHYYMFGGRGEHAVEVAAAVELAILASDILDDLQDGDAPGKPWTTMPVNQALHVASTLLTISPLAIGESVPDQETGAKLSKLLGKQLLQSAQGQMRDLINDIEDESTYLNMVGQKSTPLFVMACMAGVLAAGQPWNNAVEAYAHELGMAAQIRNDVRDLLNWNEKSDFLQRKRTLPIIWLLTESKEPHEWIAHFLDGRLTVDEIRDKEKEFREACQSTGALLYASVMGRMYYNRFCTMLEMLEADEGWKKNLLNRFL